VLPGEDEKELQEFEPHRLPHIKRRLRRERDIDSRQAKSFRSAARDQYDLI
jgi:hypothetical protein